MRQSKLLPPNKSTKMSQSGNSLAVQWLGLCILTAKGQGLIPGQGAKLPEAPWYCHPQVPKKVTQLVGD